VKTDVEWSHPSEKTPAKLQISYPRIKIPVKTIRPNLIPILSIKNPPKSGNTQLGKE